MKSKTIIYAAGLRLVCGLDLKITGGLGLFTESQFAIGYNSEYTTKSSLSDGTNTEQHRKGEYNGWILNRNFVRGGLSVSF